MRKYVILVIVLAVVAGLGYFAVKGLSLPGLGGGYTVNGVKIEVLKKGSGAEVKAGNNVTLHYTGTLKDGTKFDSSLDRNVPFTFVAGQGNVIPGFDTGVLGMKVGEKRKITIPPEMGYGAVNIGVIPPNSTIIYEVEVLAIN